MQSFLHIKQPVFFHCRSFFLSVLIGFALLFSGGGTYAQTPPDRGTIQADGFELGYQIEGNGPTALIIGSATYYSRAFSQNLREHLRLVFLDHRGFTHSPSKTDTSLFQLDLILRDVEKARQALKLGKIIVIGHSGHSYMALEYAKKYPEQVSHIVMIGIAPDLGPENTSRIEKAWVESVDPERKKAMADNLEKLPDSEIAKLEGEQGFIQNYVRNGPKAWYDPHFDSSPLWEGVRVNTAMFDYVWGKVFAEIDITAGLEDLDIPVLLALGRYDYLVAPPDTWEPYRSEFKNLTVRVFEKSGHTPPYEQPKLFDAELLQWLSGE